MADLSVATLAFTEVADLLNQVDLSAQQPALIGTNAPVGCKRIRPTERAPQPAGRALATLLATMLLPSTLFYIKNGRAMLAQTIWWAVGTPLATPTARATRVTPYSLPTRHEGWLS